MKSHNTEKHSHDALLLSTLQAFVVSKNILIGMVKGIIPGIADTITLNYRGKTFILDKDSPIVKAALSNDNLN